MDASGRRRLLKILHIDPEKNWGGGEAQVVGLLKYLTGHGHCNHLLAHPQGQLWRSLQIPNLQLWPMVAANDAALSAAWAIRRLVREQKYDIVHLHTKRAHALAAWFAGHGRSAKFVVTRRMDYPENNSPRTRWLYNRRADGIVAISRSITDLLRKAGVDDKKIRLIYSGIDPTRFHCGETQPAQLERKLIVGTLGVLEPRKGQRFLLEAAARLKKTGVEAEYQIGGSGPLSETLRKLAQELAVSDNVRFCGFVENTAEFLANVDIFVLPSLHEGLGVSALEAMAAGKPVIGTRVGGLAETIVDNVTGILVPAQDSSALALAIARLAQDRPLAAEMGTRGAERVRECFTLEQMARGNEEFYYDLLSAAAA